VTRSIPPASAPGRVTTNGPWPIVASTIGFGAAVGLLVTLVVGGLRLGWASSSELVASPETASESSVGARGRENRPERVTAR
jgi:hypothetical protein